MFNEILPVELNKKAVVVDNIRQHTIPSLIGRNYGAERVLKVLHRAGTWYASPGNLESDLLNDQYTAYYAGCSVNAPRYEIEEKLTSLRKSCNYRSFGYNMKGNYRILGCFPPNPSVGLIAPEANTSFTGAIPVLTKDYQKPESPFYYPPIFNIEQLMGRVAGKFDRQFEEICGREEVAQAVADFYFWGLAMIHPFIGGNHRAFDRFIEYAFAKKGFPVQVPQNETLNIPNYEPFNLAISQERRRLVELANLQDVSFIGTDSTQMDEWLNYQHELNLNLNEFFIGGMAKMDNIAAGLLNWI